MRNYLLTTSKTSVMKQIRFIVPAMILMSSATLAQQNGSIIKSDTIFVVKDYKPLLADADKYIFQAPLPQPDSAKLKLKYNINPQLKKLPFTPSELKPVAMSRQDEQEKLQNIYVKAGFGTQYSPFLDAHYNNGRNDKFYFSANAYHLSGRGKPLFKNFSDTRINADTRFQTKKLTIGLDGGYKTNTFYYYGFNDQIVPDSAEVLPSKDESKRTYNLIHGNLFVKNATTTKSGIDYLFNLSEKYFYTNGVVSENEIETGLKLSKVHHTIHRFNLGIGFNHISLSDSTASGSYWLLPFHPYYEYEKDKLYARAGFNLVISDSAFFIPDILVQYSLLNGKVIPFLRVDGMMDKNIMMYRSIDNPFINRNIERSIGASYNFGGGVKGSISDYVVFAAEVHYRLYNFLPIYTPDSLNQVRFSVNYAENAGVFNPHVELGFRRNDKFATTLKADYYRFDIDAVDFIASSYPEWRVTLNASYNIQEKILVTADVFLNAPVTFQYTGKRTTINTGAWADANLSVIYNYKSNFGAYLRLNNLTASQYARWYRYNTYAFVMSAGLVFKF
ncbi:MAG: hypothetical protein ACK5AS_10930 [Bacteroidota bacterium]|jgi:hypothetical protein